MRQSSKIITASPTIATSYTAGKIVGGTITLTDAQLAMGAAAILASLTAIEKGGTNKNALTVLLFDGPLTGTYTDGGAFALNAADIPLIVAKIDIATTDYTDVGGGSVANPTINPRVAKNTASGHLYAVVVSPGSATFASTSALTLRFGFFQD